MTAAPSYDRPAFHRFGTRNRCPHCRHDTPCIYFVNGDVLCHREGDPGRWTDAYIGGYWHRAADGDVRDQGARSPRERTPAPSTQAPDTADAATKHAVYSRLVALCLLSLADRDYLMSKSGHTDAMIAGNYGTLPPQAAQAALMTALIGEFGADTLRTVPGVVDVGNGHLRWSSAGLLIPVRDRAGHIQACRVRVAQPNGDKCYLWLSSSKDGGAGSGAPAHVARPPQVRDHRLYICESEKTANYLAHTLDAVVVSLAGQSIHRPALAVAEELRDQEGAEVAVLLLDAVDPADPKAEPKQAETERNRQALAAALARLGYHVKIARWLHADGKGPDDCLIAGHSWHTTVYTLPDDGVASPDAPGGLFTPTGDDENLVTVDPRVVRWLLTQVASTTTLRARYHRLLAIVRDTALNDGQKLTAIALSARLPVARADSAPEPVTVYAAAIAHDLGSQVAKQKDGTMRPTKLNTVTKNLGDLVNLGAFTREVVEVPKVVAIIDKDGQPVERQITAKSFRYQAGESLPGQRMDRDAAREAATRAKAHRERPRCPRCPRCYSTNLKPSAYVCLTCDTVASDVDAMRAAELLVEYGDGQFRHRETGEVIVPGVPVEDVGPDTALRYRDAHDETSGDEKGPNETEYRNVGTTVRLEQEYRNVVSGPPPVNTERGGSVAEDLASRPARPTPPTAPCGGGCGKDTPGGHWCKACRTRPLPPLPIAARYGAAPMAAPAGGGAS